MKEAEMMMQCDVTVIGAAIIDVLTGPVDEKLWGESSLPMESMRLCFGGDALNEAVVLSRLGVNTELISKVGNDDAGKRVLDFLRENNVHAKITVEEHLETGMNVVLIDAKGERRFLTNPASSLRKLAEEDVRGYLDTAGDIVCMASMFVSPLLDIPAMERLFKQIKRKPGRVLVADMTTAKNGETLQDIRCLLPYIDYIIPNEAEAERLTGESAVFLSAAMFVECGAPCVIIKRGAKGCLIKTKEKENQVPAYPGVTVKDTTGAGDSFVAGFVWGLRQGWSVEDCAGFGCAVASCTVEQVGANSAVTSLEEPMKRYLIYKLRSMLEKGNVILALDGGSASGKTTLAAWLQQQFEDCIVYHMDDFFLRPEQRTDKRLSEPGGNVDRERFLEEVLLPVSKGEAVTYRRFDCSTFALSEPVTAQPAKLTIIEGAYSMHPLLEKYYDYSVFLEVSATEQEKRIRKRNAPESAEKFFEKWIPLERKYFAECRVKERCNLVWKQ